jgi:hypothetical protein
MRDAITESDVYLVCFRNFIVKHRPETAPQLIAQTSRMFQKKRI